MMVSLQASVSLVLLLLCKLDALYNGNECLQPCPPFFDKVTTPEFDQTNDLLKGLGDIVQQTGMFEPRCIPNLSKYKYAQGQESQNINIKDYAKTLDTETESSPEYCLGDLKGLSMAEAQNGNIGDPRWNALMIKKEICDKFNTMDVCNLYWPCVANGMKEICDWRGFWNCTTKKCDCFSNFVETAIRSRPEDAFTSCDIGIRALFESDIPKLPDDFIVDGKFKKVVLQPEKYKLPNPIQIRLYSQAYLIEEFLEAINGSKAQREKYAAFENSTLNDQTSTLFIGMSAHYTDWDVAVDPRLQDTVSNIKVHQIEFISANPLGSKIHTTRSSDPGWMLINGDGLYHLGGGESDGEKEEPRAPAKSGIAYIAAAHVIFHSATAPLKFKGIDCRVIIQDFAEKMEISSMQMTFTRVKEVNETNPFNVMFNAAMTVRANRKDAVDYFKKKYEQQAELEPPVDTTGIKDELAKRHIAIQEREYGGQIIGELKYPTMKAGVTPALEHEAIAKAFKDAFHRLLSIDPKFMYAVKESDKFVMYVFERQQLFQKTLAAMRDEPDPFTDLDPEMNFSQALKTEMQAETQLEIDFDSWKVRTDLADAKKWYPYAAWYELSIFATLDEINQKTGITEQIGKDWLSLFKKSLFDGVGGLDAAIDTDPPETITFYQAEATPGYKYDTEISVNAYDVKQLQKVEDSGVDELDKIALRKGIGFVNTARSSVETRVSVFAGVMVEENPPDPMHYTEGLPKADNLVAVLQDILTNDKNGAKAEIIKSEKTEKMTILKVQVELYVRRQFEDYAKTILEKVRNPSFPQMINAKAAELQSMHGKPRLFVEEVALIYPAEMTASMDALVKAQIALEENKGAVSGNHSDQNAEAKQQLESMVIKDFVGKHAATFMPFNIFCTEFYTPLQFGTTISFGNLKQYFCVQIHDMLPGKNGKVLIKSRLMYTPKSPNAPDGLSVLCDYWAKKQSGEATQNPKLDEKLEQSGPGIDKTCLLFTAGKALVPDNVKDTAGDIGSLFGAPFKVMDLPDIVVTDPRPNPKFPPPGLIKLPSIYNEEEKGNMTNTTEEDFEPAYELREREVDEIPPDAYVVMAGVAIFVFLKMWQRRQKHKRMRRELLAGLEQDMDTINNIAKMSKLTADEYKAMYEKAKEKVNDWDFGNFEKRKKRKHKWAELEKLEEKQEKREQAKAKYGAPGNITQFDDSDTNPFEDVGPSKNAADDFNKFFQREEVTDSDTLDLSGVSISDSYELSD